MGIKVLSCFDGMACGMLAFMGAGIKVDRYVAYEIDKYAVQSAIHNFPMIEEKGDVFAADFTEYSGFDFLVGGSPCEPAGTKIKVFPNGYKNIEDIKVGDMVLTHKNRYKKVVRTMSRETDHLYHIKFNGSEALKLTGNHPIYVYRNNKFQWVSAEEIVVGDYVCCNINQSQNDTEYSDDMLWLLGRFVADGYVDSRPRACFCIGKKKMNEFENHLNGIHYYINHPQRSAVEYMIEDKKIVKMCQKIAHGAINKFVPDEILSLSTDKLKKFFDGYFSGDGHKRKDKKEVYMWSTTSEKLYLSMAMLSAKCFGKYPTITRKRENPVRKGFNGRLYNSRDSFNSQISLGGRKCSQRIVEDKLLIPVKNITKVETSCMVYNMQVQDDESYTSNNIITHNCTYWSIAQKNNRETEASGLGWELFNQYLRALREIKPKFFIYENNKSMSNAIRDSIRKAFGFEEICINSSLVSAQNRQRYYWAGRRNLDGTYGKVNVKQPANRGILLKDVLDGMTDREKGRAVIGSTGRTTPREYFIKQQGNMAYEPVRVGCLPSPDGTIKGSQANRIYSIDGKAVNQVANGGGLGAKTGLYAIPAMNTIYALPCEYNEVGEPIKAISGADHKEHIVYKVTNGIITIKGKGYKIKLHDGYWIIRKLTVNECKRLQTVPEWYEFPVSDTQAYKMLGNGWTIEVIKHLIESCIEKGN